MDSGKPSGPPIFLRSDIGGGNWRVTTSGALYYASWPRRVRSDVKVASFDFDTERFLSSPVVGPKEFTGSNSSPDWSPDGKYLVNFSERVPEQVLAIHSADTGALVRELKLQFRLTLPPGFGSIPHLQWTPDSKAIAVAATDSVGRQGIYRIDAMTGEAQPVLMAKAGEIIAVPRFSPDGRKLGFTRFSTNAQTLVERDLVAGNERELGRGGVVGYSPDGQYIATGGRDGNDGAVLLIPTSGGAPRVLVRAKQGEQGAIAGWAPDSRSVLLARNGQWAGRQFRVELWRAAIETGELHKVDFDPDMGLWLRIHPDGRRIAYQVSWEDPSQEVWVLENFLSAAAAKPAR